MKKEIAIAIDGPAAAGKSTVAKMVAEKLAYVYIDTGAMYRALTLKAIQTHIDLNDENALHELLVNTTITFQHNGKKQSVFLDHQDVTNEIRSQQVTNQVSLVAKQKKVRVEMVKRQQKLAQNRSVVMDGRDIGTYVIPDAEVKVFLVASVEERAKRRHKENLEKGFPSDLIKLKNEIEQRDKIDSEREAAPLVKAHDAIEMDTTDLSIEDVVKSILELAHRAINLDL